MARDDKLHGSVRFSQRTEKEREAEEVFRFFLELPNPDDPNNPKKKMLPQQILVESLIALGEKVESKTGQVILPSQEREVATVKAIVQAGIDEVKRMIGAFSTKIDSLAQSGTLTRSQADNVLKALDTPSLPDDFQNNMMKNLREGRSKRG